MHMLTYPLFFAAVMISSIAGATASSMTAGQLKGHMEALKRSVLPMFSSDARAIQQVVGTAARSERQARVAGTSGAACLPEKIPPSASKSLFDHVQSLAPESSGEAAVDVVQKWLRLKYPCGKDKS